MAKVEAASGLKPLYSFDQLVIGPHNQVAVGACMEVVKAPGETYNPLFVYGPPGVGKTHVMQAVAHQLLDQNPNFKIRYISAERFMSEILTAISEDRMLDVRRMYSVLDLLIIDDVQYMTESKISQEELFHVFNNMHHANRQVILAADRPPNQLTTLNKNIRSRLEWGLSTDIRIPEQSTRIEILKKKQTNMPGLQMTNEMSLYVATNLKSNVRELEGFLKRVHAYITLSHQELTMDLVKSVVKEILPEGAPETAVSELPASPVPNHHANGHSAPDASAPSAPVLPAAPAKAPPPAAVAPPVPLPPEPPPVAVPPPTPIPSQAPVPERPPEGAIPFNLLLDAIPEISESPAAPPPMRKSEPPVVKPAPVPIPPAPLFTPPPSPTPPPAPPPKQEPVAQASAEATPVEEELMMEEDDGSGGHKEIGAVFFYPEGCENELKTVSKKFQEVIKKHKLKFRLKGAYNHPYAYKGKINYSSFVDVCKANKVPVAVVIGPPPENFMPQQDFYDLLTVTLDVQGVSLQLVNWSEINKDYRYLNLALDIALVRSR